MGQTAVRRDRVDYAWIGFDKKIDSEIIIDILKERFNLSNCYEYSIEQLLELLGTLNLNNVREDASIVFYEVMKNESEFPVVWEFIWFPDLQNGIRVDLIIAYYLSETLRCKTITDGSGFGLDDSSYWSVVFDGGRVFLVDDLETKFCGDVDNQLKIVKELSIQEVIKI